MEGANMHNRDTGEFDHWSTEGKGVFDKKKLGRDVLSVLSRCLADGTDFTGHDGRQYVIVNATKEESDSENFIDVLVRFDEGNLVAAKYAITLQRISR
jgi:hypothetical protein